LWDLTDPLKSLWWISQIWRLFELKRSRFWISPFITLLYLPLSKSTSPKALLGAIQITRDTLRGAGALGQPKCHMSFLSTYFWTKFYHKKVLKNYVFSKMMIVTSHRGGDPEPVSPNDTWVRGSNIGQKSVTNYLNGPLSHFVNWIGIGLVISGIGFGII